jgi:hypothetical protein
MSWCVIVDGRAWPEDWGLSKEGAEYFAERFRELAQAPEVREHGAGTDRRG